MKRLALLLAVGVLAGRCPQALAANCRGACPYPGPCYACGGPGYARGYPRAYYGAGDWGYYPGYRYGAYAPGPRNLYHAGYAEYLSSGGGVGYNPAYDDGYRGQFFGASRRGH